MEIWTTESNSVKQFGLSVVLGVVGILLMAGFRNFDSSGLTESLSGFLLGVLLMFISLGSVFGILKQTIIVDPNKKEIRILSTTVFGAKERVIPFDTILNVRVAFQGKASNYIGNTYYLSLTLHDQSHCPLFFPAYFDGRGSQSVAEARVHRLQSYLT